MNMLIEVLKREKLERYRINNYGNYLKIDLLDSNYNSISVNVEIEKEEEAKSLLQEYKLLWY